MPRGSARSIRNCSQDLVLPNVGQVDFHDFQKNWNFNVLEMALETFRFAQGLHITPFTIFLRYFKTRIAKLILRNSKIWKSENLKVCKRRAPTNNRDLSNQKCFNFRGVLIGEKTDCTNRYLGTGNFAWQLLLQDLRLGELVSSSWGNRLTATGGPAPLTWSLRY